MNKFNIIVKPEDVLSKIDELNVSGKCLCIKENGFLYFILLKMKDLEHCKSNLIIDNKVELIIESVCDLIEAALIYNELEIEKFKSIINSIIINLYSIISINKIDLLKISNITRVSKHSLVINYG